MTTIYVFTVNTRGSIIQDQNTKTNALNWAAANNIDLFADQYDKLFMLKNNVDAVAFHLEFCNTFKFCFKQDAAEMLKFNYGMSFKGWAQSSGEQQ
ncbi:hypothetical protein [Burkholderia multivorans]|uniref:hypothetical protein n=1 Tax=Burkholderia multivorans TaxID=87883 RepID=UPI0005BB1DB5|nr:hypothetical protein [Burkholderia multivorans]MBU9472078.1 hypothetical protein [Burkholderia multivorans]